MAVGKGVSTWPEAVRTWPKAVHTWPKGRASTPGPVPDGLIHQVSDANPDWATARTNNSDLAKGRTRS